MNEQECDIVQHAIAAYDFLIARGQQCTASEFGKLISDYSSHPRCKIIASVVEKSKLMFARKRDGTVSAIERVQGL